MTGGIEKGGPNGRSDQPDRRDPIPVTRINITAVKKYCVEKLKFDRVWFSWDRVPYSAVPGSPRGNDVQCDSRNRGKIKMCGPLESCIRMTR